MRTSEMHDSKQDERSSPDSPKIDVDVPLIFEQSDSPSSVANVEAQLSDLALEESITSASRVCIDQNIAGQSPSVSHTQLVETLPSGKCDPKLSSSTSGTVAVSYLTATSASGNVTPEIASLTATSTSIPVPPEASSLTVSAASTAVTLEVCEPQMVVREWVYGPGNAYVQPILTPAVSTNWPVPTVNRLWFG